MACYDISAIDITTADPYLTNCAEWQSATDPEKDAALVNASRYFNARYTCVCETPQDSADEAVSWLACMDLQGKLYPTDDQLREQYVTKEMIQAGSGGGVISDTEWSVGTKFASSDFVRIDDLLSGYCRRNSGKTVTLSRD